jgi:hypothetical protein
MLNFEDDPRFQKMKIIKKNTAWDIGISYAYSPTVEEPATGDLHCDGSC